MILVLRRFWIKVNYWKTALIDEHRCVHVYDFLNLKSSLIIIITIIIIIIMIILKTLFNEDAYLTIVKTQNTKQIQEEQL